MLACLAEFIRRGTPFFVSKNQGEKMTQPGYKKPSADDLLFGGGAPSADLKNIGARVSGIIVDKDTQHETDFTTKEPKYFKSGDPVIQIVLTLQTDLRDPSREDDDGIRKVYLKAQWKTEFSKAVAATGTKAITLGAWVQFIRTHDAKSDGGGSDKKYVAVEYRLPADVALNQPAPAVTYPPAAPYMPPVTAQAYAPAAYVAPVQQAPVYAPAAPAPVAAPVYAAPVQQAPAPVNPLEGASPELMAMLAAMAAQQNQQG
jgi:hypothetical protein